MHLLRLCLTLLAARTACALVITPDLNVSLALLERGELDAVLDTRASAAYASAHIAGAALLETTNLSVIVTYCPELAIGVYGGEAMDDDDDPADGNEGATASAAAQHLESLGFKNVFDLGALQLLERAGAGISTAAVFVSADESCPAAASSATAPSGADGAAAAATDPLDRGGDEAAAPCSSHVSWSIPAQTVGVIGALFALGCVAWLVCAVSGCRRRSGEGDGASPLPARRSDTAKPAATSRVADPSEGGVMLVEVASAALAPAVIVVETAPQEAADDERPPVVTAALVSCAASAEL